MSWPTCSKPPQHQKCVLACPSNLWFIETVLKTLNPAGRDITCCWCDSSICELLLRLSARVFNLTAALGVQKHNEESRNLDRLDETQTFLQVSLS